MADKNVQLHNTSGDNLYPKTKAGNISGQLSVANGGTGASTAANARTNLGAQAALSVSAITLNFTKSSGGTLTVQDAYIYGKVVHARISVKSAAAVASGGNIWTGTLSNYKPKTQVIGPSYYDALLQMFNIQADGSVTVRNSGGSFPSGGTTTFGFCWLTA